MLILDQMIRLLHVEDSPVQAVSEGIIDCLAYEMDSLQSYLSLSLKSRALPAHLILIQSFKIITELFLYT